MALIVVVSVMNGFNRSIRDRLLEVEPHLVIDFNEINQAEQILEHPVYEKLKKFETELVAPISHQDVILRTSDGFVQHAVGNGVTRERLLQLLEFANQKSGQVDEDLKEKIENLGSGEVILGVGLADMIGLFREDTMVIIPPENLLLPSSEIPTLSRGTVKGFLLTDVERIDDRSFYYILDQSFPRLRNTAGRSIALEVWLQDAEQADWIKSQLAMSDLSIETWKERNASLFFALKIEKFVVSFLVGLSTMIAGLSIISVMVLLLTQKRKDVGNLLAMGMTKKDTKNTFVSIGMFLALFGVLGGLISGVILAMVVDRFSDDVLPAFYQETNIPAEVQVWQVGGIVLIAVVFSYFALNVTMKRLSSFKPSEILRG